MPKWTKNLSYDQDPDDIIDYDFDFSGILGSDTIASKTVTGVNVTIDSSSITDNVVTVWTSAAIDGTAATVACKIVSANATPRTIERTITLNAANI